MKEESDFFDVDNVVRSIGVYSKESDEDGDCFMLFTYQFETPVSLTFLQKLFNIDPNDPDLGVRNLIDCYNIDEEQAKALQPFVKEKLDLNKYNFMLKCHARNEIMDPQTVINILKRYLNKEKDYGVENGFIDEKFLYRWGAIVLSKRGYYVTPGWQEPNADEITALYEPMWDIIKEFSSPDISGEMTVQRAKAYIKRLEKFPTEYY